MERDIQIFATQITPDKQGLENDIVSTQLNQLAQLVNQYKYQKARKLFSELHRLPLTSEQNQRLLRLMNQMFSLDQPFIDEPEKRSSSIEKINRWYNIDAESMTLQDFCTYAHLVFFGSIYSMYPDADPFEFVKVLNSKSITLLPPEIAYFLAHVDKEAQSLELTISPQAMDTEKLRDLQTQSLQINTFGSKIPQLKYIITANTDTQINFLLDFITRYEIPNLATQRVLSQEDRKYLLDQIGSVTTTEA